ncbi:hypothetical protein GCM10023081_15350 [Arthrobacter ginkgonis]|uniref:Uncharacterized protein n=1 Tax=Arthrobacter ginkgonis TaxID=1630594 RepID=A0ABP7C6F1_9MICC
MLGLGHVDGSTHRMYGGPNSVTELQDGDRAGLAVLGSGACVPQLPPGNGSNPGDGF